ncbi:MULTISPECIES: response regulator transcription factor [Peptoniphilus]|mgnify:FL=1|uniref:response regulator transcription factor n=1 Tax=Peptoniphilus TaxID=162289 RepID=UPI0008DA088F|nr:MULTISPECIES: response regulator transcription factor [Peptoniphilus]MBS6610108.1 response regulator transcription factor [Peptoniphilus harei]MDU1043402.1 response regulator transcription factor [Peptoniphilus rhinitidis]MDU1954118.1 response regulator transcription factor [Peptoniphilus lacydonensis]MDU2110193.1 response regulator transcription factor [Peptoniphilus lacydonensis]MDU2115853.1 response regulator transcription factor [Peptoniphilus lacydonensis]
MKTKVLLVEDEESIRKFVKINLEREGYIIFEAGSGEEGIDIARSEKPDIVVLDIMLPGIDGFEVCKALRGEFPSLGIIMLTAKAEDYDKIMGLQYGTDDYLTKPFNPTELTLRIKSIERRLEPEEEKEGNLIIDPPFKIDSYSRKFYKDNEELELTPTEYQIIKIFMTNPGKAMTRDEILKLVWGDEFLGDSKIVDVNIRRLRSKIEGNAAKPDYIETVWGTGYRWK